MLCPKSVHEKKRKWSEIESGDKKKFKDFFLPFKDKKICCCVQALLKKWLNYGLVVLNYIH